MLSARRPLIAIITMTVLVIAQLIIDPIGQLALVGWPGGVPQADLWWPIARYVVFVPVLLGTTWFAARRVGDRFWVMTLAIVWSVTLAQFATLFAMTWDLALSAWGAGFVLAKGVPAALIVALVTKLAGGRVDHDKRNEWKYSHDSRGELVVWPGLIVVAAIALLPQGYWWAAPVTAESVPVPLIGRALPVLLVGLVLWIACTWFGVQFMRRRVPGHLLGPWLGYVFGGAIFGVLISLIAVVIDGLDADLWPFMSTYMRVADGISLATAAGLIGAPVTFALLALRDKVSDTSRVTSIVSAVAGGALALALVGMLVLVPPMPQRAEASAPEGFLRVEDGRIADGNGNEVLLRGVNVNQLVDFYQYDPKHEVTTPFTEEDVEMIASYGFNVIRLNISWSALEPEQGNYSKEYLAKIDDAVKWGGKHGVYIVIDMHQDGWWNVGSVDDQQCRPGTDVMWGYDGAPEWATITDGAPRCQFQGRDISPAGNRAFEHFFFNTEGIRDALAETWGMLGDRYQDEQFVAGYDLFNEPGFGETAPATTALNLGKFYDSAIEEIRKAGAEQIVFIEPSILWSGLGFEVGPHPTFTGDANIVFSPHLYAESITMDRDLGITPIITMDRQFDLAHRVADAYDTVVWSGEYGFWGDDRVPRLERYAVLEDAHGLGSAYWVWKQACGDPQNGVQPTGDGLIPQDCATNEWLEPRNDLLDVLKRPYPRVIPGELTSLSVADGTLQFTGLTASKSCDLEIWFPGEERPEVESVGVDRGEFEQVNGGWLLTGCVTDEYEVTAG